MNNNIPNSPAPAPASNEPTTPAPSAEPTKPIMGTTPTRQRNQAPEPAAPTTPEGQGEGTEGGQAPAATPQNNGQGSEPEPDYKVKFSESSKEAQRLLGILKAAGIDPETGQPIAQADSTPPAPAQEPTRPAVRGEQPTQPNVPLTDEQLTAAIPGFANLSEAEKNIIRDTKATVKQMAELKNLVAELYDEREFKKQMKDLTGKEQWKAISEHSDEFKEYAYKQENLTVPLETLAASFLYQKGLASKPAEQKPTPPPAAGLEPGSGGGKQGDGKTTADGYTAEELANIRQTDPKKYAQLAREGKLKLRS